jgi:putative two-component system response regulator
MDKEKARILIVDDEVYIREILSATLQEAGYRCVSVATVEAAESVLGSQRIDIALTDVRMPNKDGKDLLQFIQKNYPGIVVIMVTALDSASLAIEMIRAGAYDYLIKPFNLEQVVIAADRAVEKRKLESASHDYQKYLELMAEERAAETRRLFYSMTRVLVHLLDLKVPFNAGHVMRVAELSRWVARDLKMTEDGVRKVYLAGLLHDVGMITARDVLLTKSTPLTADERRHIQMHSAKAEEVLRPILDDEEVLKYIRHHRERFDGTGYPDGLKGQIIPLGARIIAVTEAFDAMTRTRPYRQVLSRSQALSELRRCAGTQFDTNVVTVFQEIYERGFAEIDQNPAGQA